MAIWLHNRIYLSPAVNQAFYVLYQELDPMPIQIGFNRQPGTRG